MRRPNQSAAGYRTMTKTTFGELPHGARFLFRGKRYVKVAMSMAP